MTSLRDRVEALLGETPAGWYTPNSLAARLDGPADGTDPGRETVADVLDTLVDAGLVERDGSSYRWQVEGSSGRDE